VPPLVLSGSPASLISQEGLHVIVASPSGNFEPCVSLLPTPLPTHHFSITQPHLSSLPPPTRTSPALSLSSSCPIDTHLPPDPHLQNSNFTYPTHRTHTMTTRSINRIFKPKQVHTISKHSLPPILEPTSVNQAISHHRWHEAMSTELTALMKHGTWDLVLPPSRCKPVGCKWVFWVKRKANGSVERFKARLVAIGYNQRPCVDYKQTFSPVVEPATIRTILSLAVMHSWDLRQLDVNNAFLNGELTEIFFMVQPSGFKDLSKPDHVCRLKKAIYGLKQASRAWYTALKIAILLFLFTAKDQISVISLYMLMILLLLEIILFLWLRLFSSWVICSLSKIWVLFIFFQGVEVIPTRTGLFLSQHKYIRELLASTSMSGAKDVSTPLSTTTSL